MPAFNCCLFMMNFESFMLYVYFELNSCYSNDVSKALKTFGSKLYVVYIEPLSRFEVNRISEFRNSLKTDSWTICPAYDLKKMNAKTVSPIFEKF